MPGQDDDRRRTGRHGVVPLAPPSSFSPPARTPVAVPPVTTAAPPRRRRRRSPTRVHPRPAGPLLLLAPLFVVTGAVGLGALHAWLGLPLGGAFAAELWGVAKNLGIMLIPYIPAALGVHRTNRAALAYDRELAAEEAAKRWRPIPPVNRRRDERALARGRTEAHDGGGDEREAGAGEDDVRPADPDEEGDDDDHDHHGRDPRGRTPSAPVREHALVMLRLGLAAREARKRWTGLRGAEDLEYDTQVVLDVGDATLDMWRAEKAQAEGAAVYRAQLHENDARPAGERWSPTVLALWARLSLAAQKPA